MVDEFPGLFLIVIVVFLNRSGIWKVSCKFLDFLSAVDLGVLALSFTALISKYSVSSLKSSSHSCHVQPVSKGLSGILNKFILSDFPKVETQISDGLLVLLCNMRSLMSGALDNFFFLFRF